MRWIKYIVAVGLFAWLLASCSQENGDPKTVWGEGQAPIALRAVAPLQSRTPILLNDTNYDIYACGIYITQSGLRASYYTVDNDPSIFKPMAYDATNKLFFMPQFYMPVFGKFEILSFGVETGKSITPDALPRPIGKKPTADYMMLDLTTGYDGSFDVIACDRVKITCSSDIEVSALPYAYYHHIMAHLKIKIVWDPGVPADAPIIDRLVINSVQLKNTSSNGRYYMAYNVTDGFWEDQGDDAILTPGSTPQLIDYTSGLDLGDVFVIPQDTRQKIVINYTVRNGNTGSITERTMNYVVSDPDTDLSKGWLAGKEYTYTIRIGRTGEFSVNNVIVEPFAPGNVGDTSIY